MYRDVKVSVTISIPVILKMIGCFFGKAYKVSLS